LDIVFLAMGTWLDVSISAKLQDFSTGIVVFTSMGHMEDVVRWVRNETLFSSNPHHIIRHTAFAVSRWTEMMGRSAKDVLSIVSANLGKWLSLMVIHQYHLHVGLRAQGR
jgi:hypothetical protein